MEQLLYSYIILFLLISCYLKKLNNFIYLFLSVLGLCCCAGFSAVVAGRGHSLVAVHGFFIAVGSLVMAPGL